MLVRSEGGVRKPAGTLYRGREGMWTWVAHRISGVLVFFYLFAHVLDTALIRVTPDACDRVIATYENPVVNVMEVGLVGAVVLDALNGIRIILVDFWGRGPRLQRQMAWAVAALWLVLMMPGAYFVLERTVRNLAAANGLHTVINDYAERPQIRFWPQSLLVLSVFLTVSLGTLVIFTFSPEMS